jgi:hypothetical protein
MEKDLLEELKEGDPVSVALRGGAGWVHGSLVWRKEGIMLLETKADDNVRQETPYALVMLSDVSAVAVPRKLGEPGLGARSPGFNR